MRKVLFSIFLSFLLITNSYALLSQPPVLKDTSLSENQYLQQIYENYNVTSIVTSSPNGNTYGKKGQTILYNNSGTYTLWSNTDGGTTWQQISPVDTATQTTANTKYIYFVIPDDTLTTGTDKIGRIYMDFAGTIQEAHASVKTAPTGADIIVDLNLNGSTIWSTQGNRVTISATTNTGTQSTFNTTTFSSGDYLTIDLDQVGSTVAGAKLVVRLKVLKT